jgi:hypothetical protein
MSLDDLDDELDDEFLPLDEEDLEDIDEEDLVEEDVEDELDDEVLVASPGLAVGEEVDIVDSAVVDSSLDHLILGATETSVEDEDDISNDDLEAEDSDEFVAHVIPKQPDEFTCQSCFLVKKQYQLADKEHQICKDCV